MISNYFGSSRWSKAVKVLFKAARPRKETHLLGRLIWFLREAQRARFCCAATSNDYAFICAGYFHTIWEACPSVSNKFKLNYRYAWCCATVDLPLGQFCGFVYRAYFELSGGWWEHDSIQDVLLARRLPARMRAWICSVFLQVIILLVMFSSHVTSKGLETSFPPPPSLQSITATPTYAPVPTTGAPTLDDPVPASYAPTTHPRCCQLLLDTNHVFCCMVKAFGIDTHKPNAFCEYTCWAS